MTEAADQSPKPKSRIKRILRALGMVVLVAVLFGMNIWAALAINFANLSGGSPRRFLAGLFLVAVAAAVWFARPKKYAILASLVSFVIVLIWFFSIKPLNDRDWAPDVAKLASAQINGNLLTIHNVRNFDYRSETDFTQLWEDRTYDLDKLRTTDLTLCYWGSKAVAHGIVSFGFDDGQYLAISIETRKQTSESYSAVEGFFRQYELIYIVADERDVLRVRTNYRKEDLYTYRSEMDAKEARAVLMSYVESSNSLRDRPQFYNALTSNCVTDIVPHAQAGNPAAHIGWQILLSGYAARQAYQNGHFDQSMPFEQLEARSHINEAAIAADKDPGFSNRIRIGLPMPAPRGGPAN